MTYSSVPRNCPDDVSSEVLCRASRADLLPLRLVQLKKFPDEISISNLESEEISNGLCMIDRLFTVFKMIHWAVATFRLQLVTSTMIYGVLE